VTGHRQPAMTASRLSAILQNLQHATPRFAVRESFQSHCWQDYVGMNPSGQFSKLAPGAPLELAISTLGVNGVTAQFGLLDVGRPVAGETSLSQTQPAQRAPSLARSQRGLTQVRAFAGWQSV
jgi:hypothetical protein